MPLAKFVFQIGRRVGKHPLAGTLFCTTERFLPLNRIARTDSLVVFHHPRPIDDPHVLIVPTRPIASLITPALHDEQCAELIWQMIELGRESTKLLANSEQWQLAINGGKRQDIGQLHAHLMHAVSGRSTGVGIALSNPKIKPDPWRELFTMIREADQARVPEYTLVIRWSGQLQPVAEVS